MSTPEPLDKLSADAQDLGLSILFDLKITGTDLAWYAAAVQVITALARSMGTQPEWTDDSIYLRFYRHPNQFVVYARNPTSRIAHLLGEGEGQ